jgi:drug/metabolite transporter (DMT)-like permease
MSYHRAKASEVAIYNYLGIFVALGLGYWFFAETFSLLSLLGMMVVMVAIFVSHRLNLRK